MNDYNPEEYNPFERDQLIEDGVKEVGDVLRDRETDGDRDIDGDINIGRANEVEVAEDQRVKCDKKAGKVSRRNLRSEQKKLKVFPGFKSTIDDPLHLQQKVRYKYS